MQPYQPPQIKCPKNFSFWANPQSAFANFCTTTFLPSEADVVIVGSGFSGSSVAYHLLVDNDKEQNTNKIPPKHVVMLEARQTCSGATGRNGGHLHPGFEYDAFTNEDLSESEKKAAIEKMIFDMMNFQHLKKIISENELPDTNTEFKPGDEASPLDGMVGWAVYDNAEEFTQVCNNVSLFIQNLHKYSKYVTMKDNLPKIYFKEEARKRTGLSNIVGAIHLPATPLSGYRLVSWLLHECLTKGNLNLQTNTPVYSVMKQLPPSTFGSTPSKDVLDIINKPYLVTTSKGVIRAAKVVFATNGYTGNTTKATNPGKSVNQDKKSVDSATSDAITVSIKTQLRTPIHPVRGQVAHYTVPKDLAQLTRLPISKDSGRLSLVWKDEYFAVLPNLGKQAHDTLNIVYGGCRRFGASQQYDMIDDNSLSDVITWTLDDFLQTRIGIPVATSQNENNSTISSSVMGESASSWWMPKNEADETKVKAVKTHEWTGIMGFTEDGNPCVGSLNKEDDGLLIIGGFGGHGMPRIFLSAKALVEKYFGSSGEWPEWFPEAYIN